jgi:hypothetical protein
MFIYYSFFVSVVVPASKVPFGHWSSNMDNIRAFFDKLAEKLQFDPLVAHNWYNITTHTVLNEKVSREIDR